MKISISSNISTLIRDTYRSKSTTSKKLIHTLSNSKISSAGRIARLSPVPFQQDLPQFDNGAYQPNQENTLQAPLYFCSKLKNSPTRPISNLLYERPKDHYEKIHLPSAIGYAFQFDMKGKLMRSREGHYFLQVSDSFQTLCQSVVQPFGAQIVSGIGSQIGVIMPSEYEKHKLWGKVGEVGKTFYFGFQGCYEIELGEHDGYEKVWIIKVQSPAIEDLREKYGLTRRFQDQDLMLVIGVKERRRPLKQSRPEGTFRIHPGSHPA